MEPKEHDGAEIDPRADEEKFEEIGRLMEEGWRFDGRNGGNVFEPDQRYHIFLEKEGEESREFVTSKPYPKSLGPKGTPSPDAKRA